VWTNLLSSCNSFAVRRRFRHENCSVARTLEIVGDWWTLLVVRTWLPLCESWRLREHRAEAGDSLLLRTDHHQPGDHGVPIQSDGKPYKASAATMTGADIRALATPPIGPDRSWWSLGPPTT
jgi:hypothetical protein